MPETRAFHGKVAWFNNAKGYGFLTPDSGQDVFVHYTAVQAEGYKSLQEGGEVMFDIVPGPKGPQADRVIVIQPERKPPAAASPLGCSLPHGTLA